MFFLHGTAQVGVHSVGICHLHSHRGGAVFGGRGLVDFSVADLILKCVFFNGGLGRLGIFSSKPCFSTFLDVPGWNFQLYVCKNCEISGECGTSQYNSRGEMPKYLFNTASEATSFCHVLPDHEFFGVLLWKARHHFNTMMSVGEFSTVVFF